MEAIKILFQLGLAGYLAIAAGLFGLLVSFISVKPVLCTIGFILFVFCIAFLALEVEKRRGAAGRAETVRTVQTMQIKVEADTSQALAAVTELEERVKFCTDRMIELNRLTMFAMMEDS